MTDLVISVGGVAVERVSVYVPPRGAWFADVALTGDDTLAGAVVLQLGALELHGTIDARYTGTFGLQTRARVVAGAAGWGKLLAPKAYHNDAGVRSQLVADDAAREAGETLVALEAPAGLIVGARDYAREAGEASRVLEDAFGPGWYVDYDGQTHVGAWPSSPATDGAFDVLDYDPRTKMVTLTVDDPGAVRVGSVLSAPQLPEPLTVRELELDAIGHELVTMRAWCGGSTSSRGRLLDAFAALVQRLNDGSLLGIYKYRVGQMSVDRVELQAVTRAAGLPDLIPLSMWPGVAGAHAALTPGAEVLVQFVGGRRGEPIVTHFAGKDGNGWAPTNLTFDAVALIKLGASASQFVALAADTKARLDTIQSTFDAHTHPYVAGVGSPIAGAPTPTQIGPLGPIAATKVKAE